MGFTAKEIGEMSMWEYTALVDGWVAANSPPEAMSDNEMDEIWAWMQTKESRVH